jgi:hypothetical protein
MNIHETRRNTTANGNENPPKFSSSRAGLTAFPASNNPNLISTSFQHLEVRDARGTATRGGKMARQGKLNLAALGLIVFELAFCQVRPLFSHDAILSAFWNSLSLGVGLFVYGVLLKILRERLGQSKIANLKRKYPGECYRWDYPWDKEGASDKSKSVLRSWLIAMLMFAFAVPLNVATYANASNPTMQTVVSGLIGGLLDLALLVHIVRSIYKSVRFLRYGSSRVKFAHFPYSLTEKIELTLLEASRLQGCTKIEAKLRCVEERLVVESIGQRLVEHLVAHQLYAETQQLKPLASNQDRIKLCFQAPGDARLSTDLEDDCPRYWELEIRAELPGVDYNSVFLLPIYARTADLQKVLNRA